MSRPSGSEFRSNDWRSPDLQSEGTRIRALSPPRRFGEAPSYTSNCLVGQSAMLKGRSVQGCRRANYETYRPLDDHRVILSTSKAFGCFQARPDENPSHLIDPPFFELDLHRRPDGRSFQKHILDTIFHQIWIKTQKNFPNVF